MENPERFDPRNASGTLIDSEHRARYHFGAQVVAGKDVLDAACGLGYGIEILAHAGAAAVTGVDLDAGAIAEAESRVGKQATALVEADLRELPLEDDSFDVVVSFETIEHMEEPEQALAELRRVLRPDGVLVISSPNPDAYVGGNEHHVHEFRPEELAEAVGGLFKNSASFRQDAWLGSSIRATGDGDADQEILRTTAGGEQQPYTIVVASDRALPDVHGILTVGDTFEVRWWSEQVDNNRQEAIKASAREVQAIEREQNAGRELINTSEALVQANRELAKIPVLEHKLAALEELHRVIGDRYSEMLESTSWKITAPLRRKSG